MSALLSDIIDRAIEHARALSKTAAYDWSTARAALTAILADLERRFPGDPSLDRLRLYIAERDQALAADPAGLQPRNSPRRP